uniref:Uncharacterized protein n=1 Tax=Schistocephalus solidus TaxID=70667 RepID=A0A0X3P665_SCHSO
MCSCFQPSLGAFVFCMFLAICFYHLLNCVVSPYALSSATSICTFCTKVTLSWLTKLTKIAGIRAFVQCENFWCWSPVGNLSNFCEYCTVELWLMHIQTLWIIESIPWQGRYM